MEDKQKAVRQIRKHPERFKLVDSIFSAIFSAILIPIINNPVTQILQQLRGSIEPQTALTNILLWPLTPFLGFYYGAVVGGKAGISEGAFVFMRSIPFNGKTQSVGTTLAGLLVFSLTIGVTLTCYLIPGMLIFTDTFPIYIGLASVAATTALISFLLTAAPILFISDNEIKETKFSENKDWIYRLDISDFFLGFKNLLTEPSDSEKTEDNSSGYNPPDIAANHGLVWNVHPLNSNFTKITARQLSQTTKVETVHVR